MSQAPHVAAAWAGRGPALAALVALSLLLVPLYAMNPGLGDVREAQSAGLTAHSLLRQGDLGIEEYFPQVKPGEQRGYSARWRGGHLVSIEPLASSLTFLPFVWPYRDVRPGQNRRLLAMFPPVAARVAAFALLALGICLLGIASVPRALAVTAILALATPYRTIVGGALWQHTSAAPWLALGLLLWTSAERRSAFYVAAGAALAVATACRPVLVPAPLLLLADVWWSARPPLRARLLATLVVTAIGGAALFANVALHGSLLGGRVDIVAAHASHSLSGGYFRFSPLHIAGLLVAPSRGLLVYSPVLLFAIAGAVRCLRSPDPEALRWITLAGLGVLLSYGAVATWWAGVVYGPRYGADLLPFAALWLAVAPLPRRRRPLWGALFALALVWSLAVQELGARTYPCGWNTSPIHVDVAPSRVWSLRDTQIHRCVEKLLAGT